MTKNRIINIILLLVIVSLTLAIIFTNSKSNTDKEEKIDYVNYESKELQNETTIDNFLVKDISIYYVENEGTTLITTINNKYDKDYFIKGITVKVYNKNKDLIATLYNDFMVNIEKNNEIECNFKTSKNIINDYDTVEYIINYIEIEE